MLPDSAFERAEQHLETVLNANEHFLMRRSLLFLRRLLPSLPFSRSASDCGISTLAFRDGGGAGLEC